MITAQVEGFRDNVEELRTLIPHHYDALSLHKEKGFPLVPDWETYFARERRDELLFVTLRKDGRMIGYWIAFIAPGLHYTTCLTSIMDIWFIHPEHIVGKAPVLLVKTVERELERRGVKLSFAGSKNHKPCGPFLERMGYEKVESTYAKWMV